MLYHVINMHIHTQGICSDGDVRLQDGETEYEGRIEVCYRNVWGTVCDHSINNAVATVVCTQRGLPIHGEESWAFFQPAQL